MGTVDKNIADEIISGKYPEDKVTLIVEYDNAFGGVSYGVVFRGNVNTYTESEFVRNPRVYYASNNGGLNEIL